MQSNTLISIIYSSIPSTYKGLDIKGRHVICFKRHNQPYYATLENLTELQLENLAQHFSIQLPNALAAMKETS
ncbi:MAG: hypothetical protein K0S29_802 [Gammaproteobacteria bacterium]|jgi:hypothetical protein|nr:hypothetical protein [Gammaproteobacteria bacterium]